jgi:UDP-N-acetylglucosamine--N-acetylmuramyl-(pentapeptide) pyrophosphoryl-undecaprenol N-acetylglucosamine transferase
MVAGGTGGHIFPALSVAQELKRRSEANSGARYEILFVGTGRGIEDRVIPAAGFGLRKIPGAGLKGIGGWRRIRNLLVLPKSVWQSAHVLSDFRPHVVVGLGGYIAGPAMLLAALKGIPTLLIEPNAVPGFTNRLLAPVVSAAAVAFEETAKVYGRKARVTGNPIRAGFDTLPVKPFALPNTVLVLGGSLGATAINDAVISTLDLLRHLRDGLRFVHQSGERDYNRVRQAYQDRAIPAEVHAFIEDVPAALAAADVVISRAGGNAVAELAAAGKACILVPFPGAADQHQLANARAFQRAGAAIVIEQENLSWGTLGAAVGALLGPPERRATLEHAARAFARPRAAAEVADIIESLVRKRSKE